MLKAFISVLLPFRNAGETLDAALSGLIARTDSALEVLALDDGSTDSGPSRVREWSRRDARVRLLRTRGSGLVKTLGTGLAHCRGGLVARMDADDLTHPERLHRQREALLAQPDIAVLGSRVTAFTTDGVVSEGMQRYVMWQNSLLSPEDHRRELFVESPLCHPSIMLRRAALLAAGGYQETGGPEDYELFMRLSQLGYGLAKLPDVLLAWRHRTGRATFADPRYSLARMRAAKAPFLAARVKSRPAQRRVLWGVGPTGRRLMRALAAYDLRFDACVDIDPKKVGRSAQGVPIYAPEALDPARDFVLAAVGARGAREQIRAFLSARGFVEGDSALFGA